MYTFNFKRRELKFLLDLPTRYALQKEMRTRMEQDEFGPSTICSVYLDTPNFLLLRRSMEHPLYKEKLRLRSYGPIESDDEVFLELKKKCEGIVYKRRAHLSQEKANELLSGKDVASSQIERELSYSVKRYENLAPRMYIAYDREAYFDPNDRDFRMTFDRNVRARTDNLTLCSESYGTKLISEDLSILEVKTPKAAPLRLVDFLTNRHCFKSSWSKYSVAFETLYQDTILGG